MVKFALDDVEIARGDIFDRQPRRWNSQIYDNETAPNTDKISL
jgi:hypothetical protein